MDKQIFKLEFLPEAIEFIRTMPAKAQDKLFYNIDRAKGGERNKEIFKKLEGTEIWEFRALANGISYRLFAFWDKDEEVMVVATHGLIKKTQKTPDKEINKAERIRKQYFENKQ